MAAAAFNLVGEAARKELGIVVNVGTPLARVWERQGFKIESAAISLNVESESVNDINGETNSTVTSLQKAITFAPSVIRKGSTLQEMLIEFVRKNELDKFSSFEVGIIWGFIGDAGAYAMDIHTKSTIYPTEIGGDSRVNMPIDVTLGGTVLHGTVDKKAGDVYVFTPEAAPAIQSSKI